MAYPNYYPNTYGQQFQQPVQPQIPAANQTPTFTCRPVTSREEALAVQTDFFSPGTLMPDMAHGVIYMKRFNSNTGSSDFMEFAYQHPVEKVEPKYATLDDLAALKAEIESMKKVDKK